MNTKTFGKRAFYALAPLAVLLLIDFAPVSHAADLIPDSSKDVAVADSVAPSDVDNMKATAGDASATLTWNVATDNIGVKGYRLYYGPTSVTADGGSYETGPVEVGNKISYTVNGLDNGTKYYFSVTAYDLAGNESENYSVEASATPLHGAADQEAPKVTKADAVDKMHVKVTFSEAVQVPNAHAESAFSIKNDTTSVQLDVKKAMMDSTDPTHKTVLLETANQQAGASYILTAGIDIKDTSGNPLVSGTSDTAAFTGTDIVPQTQEATQQPTQETQQAAPQLLNVQAMDATHLEVIFSKAVVLKEDKRENFIITEEDDIATTLEVTSVDQDSTGTMITLTTAPMKAISYNLIAIDVTDPEGNQLSLENNATTFTGVAGENMTEQTTMELTQQALDNMAPEDVSDFAASMVKKLIVTLNWTRSLNSSNDLAEYVLYMSTDGSNYGTGIMVSPNSDTFDVTKVVPGVKYFFKLAARDTAGNESTGVVTTFVLPGTGPELGLLLLGSLGAGKLFKRRKKTAKK